MGVVSFLAQLEGVAYRGRLLVEVTTSVGVLPKEKHEEIKPQYIRAAKVRFLLEEGGRGKESKGSHVRSLQSIRCKYIRLLTEYNTVRTNTLFMYLKHDASILET